MRSLVVMVLVTGALGAWSGCGEEPDPATALPSTGQAYRELGDAERLAVAKLCRERAVAAADGVAARDLADVAAAALREQLDAAFRLRRQQHRPVAAVCTEQIPFVTPGARVSFERAEPGGGVWTYETDSDIPLEIRGTIAPAPRGGVVVARRESGSRAYRGRIGTGGQFALPAIRLRKVADNTFVIAIRTPPSAPRKLYFSAICLDCLAAGTPAQ